jgi:cobalt-zinc-cadmium efflux system membrane fusion protein
VSEGRTRRWAALVSLVALAVAGGACRKQPDGAKPPEPHGQNEKHEPHEEAHTAGEHARVAEATPGVLRIDPGMVRDLRVRTAVVEGRPGGEGVTLLGELQVNQDGYAEVGTPVEGRAARLAAAPGDLVKAGAPLVEIDSVTLGRARAAEATAAARAELARQVVERKRRLVADNVAPGRELDEAEADGKAAEAELRAARTSLRAFGAGAGAGGSRFALRAPIAGTVLERNVALGQNVGPEAPLFRIADLKVLWLTVQAFERDALRLKPGSVARVAFPALPGRSLAGKVTWIGSQVDVTSRTIPVRVTVANGDGVLRPGMSASAWLPVGGSEGNVVAVPIAAVQRLDDDWVVFVPRQEAHSFDIRRVGRGRDLGGEVEILSSLKAGETVVVDGAFLLKAEAEKSKGMGEHHEH